MSESNYFETEQFEYNLLQAIVAPWQPTGWNDFKATSKEDVISLLQKAYTHECARQNQIELSSAPLP